QRHLHRRILAQRREVASAEKALPRRPAVVAACDDRAIDLLARGVPDIAQPDRPVHSIEVPFTGVAKTVAVRRGLPAARDERVTGWNVGGDALATRHEVLRQLFLQSGDVDSEELAAQVVGVLRLCAATEPLRSTIADRDIEVAVPSETHRVRRV